MHPADLLTLINGMNLRTDASHVAENLKLGRSGYIVDPPFWWFGVKPRGGKDASFLPPPGNDSSLILRTLTPRSQISSLRSLLPVSSHLIMRSNVYGGYIA